MRIRNILVKILVGVSLFAAGCSTSTSSSRGRPATGPLLDTGNPTTTTPTTLPRRLAPPDIVVGKVTVTQTPEPLPCSMSVEIRNVGNGGRATNIVVTARLETAGSTPRTLNEVPLHGSETLNPGTSAVYRGDFDRYFLEGHGPVRATISASMKETRAEPVSTGGLYCL